ncbi:MAG TPA: hypothetical protein VKQ34_04245 [Candidatus Saccharimonadales bacterium]|nr:hypothetical protein [Candidatus Saccharimonadales bacterium]
MRAAGSEGDFNIQVSPSPLVVTLVPGQSQTARLTVRNFTAHTETLNPGLQGFTIDDRSQKITLNNNIPAGMQDWVHFKQSALTLSAGASLPLDITFDTPANVGFSYSLAITLSRPEPAQPLNQPGAQLQPKVAVFCLVNINRPDAKSKLAITDLSSKQSHYTFLPATFSTSIANQGNVIMQPAGTLFIQRSFDAASPIVSLPINPDHGYVLPGSTRTFTSDWTNGFPVYVTQTVDGKKSVHLSWNWKHVSELRFGRYVAKAVLVYNDGHRDLPVIASTTFWVIPWWLLLCAVLVLIVLVMGLIGWGWVIFKGTKKVRGYAHTHRK